jgi:hypothetical protein
MTSAVAASPYGSGTWCASGCLSWSMNRSVVRRARHPVIGVKVERGADGSRKPPWNRILRPVA